MRRSNKYCSPSTKVGSGYKQRMEDTVHFALTPPRMGAIGLYPRAKREGIVLPAATMAPCPTFRCRRMLRSGGILSSQNTDCFIRSCVGACRCGLAEKTHNTG